ncbi:MAG: NAD-dependent epimerase/dehydratase family protein [Candidatus Saccharimonadales bacterium]
MTKIIVTGANGFVGTHLQKELLDNNIEVVAINGPQAGEGTTIDLTDTHAVAGMRFDGVDAIIHLAGMANVGRSFDEPQPYVTSSSLMALNLLEAMKAQQSTARFILVSTGAVYAPGQHLPISETSFTAASSPYVISKLVAEDICEYYASRGLDCVVARPFNHIGPGQLPGFLVPDLIQQIRQALQNNSPLKVGNLKTKRDYTDVRDVARAYRLLATTPKLSNRTYNICSSHSLSGEEILAEITKNIPNADRVTVEVDPNKLRPNDIMDIYGSNERLSADTDWQPQITISQTIKNTLNI